MQRPIRSALRLFSVLVLVSGIQPLGESPALGKTKSTAGEPASRSFRFDYGATITGLSRGSRVRVWMPVARSDEHQQVVEIESSLPAQAQTAVEPVYGNKILYFETTAPASQTLSFNRAYWIRRSEIHGLKNDGSRTELTFSQRQLFLSANSKVPLTGKQLDLLEGVSFSTDPLDTARRLFNIVDAHVRYDKSRAGFGNGDVHWVCDSRFGNCTDFHSLFISLSRSMGLPARFEIGFPLPERRGEGKIAGYHCWALFHNRTKGWIPVDISEADKVPEMKQYYFGNLTENRVTFTTGRDIQLVPRQEGAPLNYFVYPYVEVDGQPWPADKLEKRFKFRDN